MKLNKKALIGAAATFLLLTGAGVATMLLPWPSLLAMVGLSAEQGDHPKPEDQHAGKDAHAPEHVDSTHEKDGKPKSGHDDEPQIRLAAEDAPHSDEHATEEGDADHGSAGDGHGGKGTVEIPDHLLLSIPRTESRLLALVRKLQIVQSAAAAGNNIPGLTQRDALQAIAEELPKLNAVELSKDELDAIITYIFSGGTPGEAELMLERLPRENPRRKVLDGAIRFVRADRDEARKLLAELDVGELPAGVASRVALAQAQLAGEDEDELRSQKLMLAANLAPGTLVEEAATRRLVSFFGTELQRGKFTKWAERYGRRFPNSFYLGEFEYALTTGILNLERAGKPVDHGRMTAVLSHIQRESATRVLLTVSQQAAISGFRDLCLFASSAGLDSFAPDGASRARFQLYKAACEVTLDAEKSLSALKAIEQDQMEELDRRLAKDAISLALAIVTEREPSTAFEPRPTRTEPKADDNGSDALIASATQQLENTKEVLQEADQ